MKGSGPGGWWVWSGGLFLLILVPFLVYGDRLENVARTVAEAGVPRWTAAFALGALLSGDIVLPVPSSGVSAAIGALIGFWWGMLLSSAFMTVACIIGYVIGQRLGRPVARRLVGEAELRHAERLSKRHGDWAILGLRAVPVLAEASVVAAGTAGVPFLRFLLGVTIANVGISAAYAGAGSVAIRGGPLALAFAGAVGLTFSLAWLGRRIAAPRTRRDSLPNS